MNLQKAFAQNELPFGSNITEVTLGKFGNYPL